MLSSQIQQLEDKIYKKVIQIDEGVQAQVKQLKQGQKNASGFIKKELASLKREITTGLVQSQK